MSDLIVMSFDSVATAEEVRDKIRQLQKAGLVALFRHSRVSFL